MRELAVEFDAEPARVEVLLDRLQAAGLIDRTDGPPPRYSVIEPSMGFAEAIARQETRARETARLSRNLTQQLAQRFRERSSRNPVDLIEIVVWADGAVQRMFQLERSVRSEIRGIDMPPYLHQSNEIEVELMATGVTSRWLCDRTSLEIPGKLAEISRFRDGGEEARLVSGAPFKLVLADDQLAMIPFTDASSGPASALLIGPSSLLEGLSRLFESLWRYAIPLQPTGADDSSDRPDPAESQLLALLAAGLTDRVVGSGRVAGGHRRRADCRQPSGPRGGRGRTARA